MRPIDSTTDAEAPTADAPSPAAGRQGGGRKVRVAILWRYIAQYRSRFYQLLRARLEDMGIDLVLVYGQPDSSDTALKDSVQLEWGNRVRNIYITVGRWELCWQPAFHLLRDADLVIVDQANRLLINYILMLRARLGMGRIAFWGHGRNFQAKPGDRFSEWIKRLLCTKVDWWFAYNELSASLIEGLGFPRHRITVVRNAIDTTELRMVLRQLKPEEVEARRQQLRLAGGHTGLYVGGMYPDRQIAFLLNALVHIRRQVPDFEMIFLGAGPEADLIEKACKLQPWIHYVGPLFGKEKVPYFALSQVFLMPGVVGLCAVDCIAMGVPLITTRSCLHGPEIEYLQPGVNGLMVDARGNPQVYAQAVVEVLRDEAARRQLVDGCSRMSAEFSVENMAENFAGGICQALGRSREIPAT